MNGYRIDDNRNNCNLKLTNIGSTTFRVVLRVSIVTLKSYAKEFISSKKKYYTTLAFSLTRPTGRNRIALKYRAGYAAYQ